MECNLKRSLVLFDLSAIVSGNWQHPTIDPETEKLVAEILTHKEFDAVGLFSYQIWSVRDRNYYNLTIQDQVNRIIGKPISEEHFYSKYDIMQKVRTQTSLWGMRLSDFDDFFKRPSDSFTRLFVHGAWMNIDLTVVGNEQCEIEVCSTAHNSRLKIIPLQNHAKSKQGVSLC